MTDFARLETSTIDHEAFVDHPYPDSKKLWTFAIGRCLETNPLTAEEWRYLLDHRDLTVSISYAGATWLMRRGHAACELDCKRAFADFWLKLNDARQNILVEMVYQMSIDKVRGTPNIRGFKDMLAAIRRAVAEPDPEKAKTHWAAVEAAGLDSKWAKEDSPGRARKMMQQMRCGEFPVLGGSREGRK